MSRHAALLALALLLSLPASAYKLLGAAWDADRGPVPFHLEPNGSQDIDDGSDLDAVRSAFRRWSCVQGSRLRLEEGKVPGAKEAEADDGRNSVFWDEDGTFGLGVATLGITIGPAGGEGGGVIEQSWATIVFNGVHHTWSALDDRSRAGDTVDVESIAVHEAGHWIGLGHPCEDPQETICLGHDEAVMHPTYPGGIARELRSDDIAGAQALYPQEDDSTCQGPYRQGERCGCNDECVDGLLCVPTDDGGVCAPPCSSGDVTCPAGFVCQLSEANDDGEAPGICRKLSPAGAPPGAICQRDDDCAEGLCARAAAVGRTVCRVSCDADEDCPSDQECFEGACLSVASRDGIECASDEDCMCSSVPLAEASGPPAGALSLLALLLGLVALVGERTLRAPSAQRAVPRAPSSSVR